MPKRNQTYQYGADDDPVTVANQFGITPQQLLAANPGGAPFTTGQNINVPYQYNAMVANATQQQQAVTQANAPSIMGVSNAIGGLPTRTPNPPGTFAAAIQDMVGTPTPYNAYGPNRGNFSYDNPHTYGTDDAWHKTVAEQQAARRAQYRMDNGLPPPVAPTLAGGDFYGYERDPVTGRSERVVKNSATSNFLKELRWDPQTRKYVSIGRLLKQGKLDLKGNWNSTGKRQRRNANLERKKKQQQTQQDFTLSNSLISFGASSG